MVMEAGTPSFGGMTPQYLTGGPAAQPAPRAAAPRAPAPSYSSQAGPSVISLGGFGGAFPPPPAASAPAPFTNTAQQDPNLQRQVGRINERLDNPEGSTGRAIDMSTAGIRDANEGRRKAIKGMLSKRGVLSSSSIPEFGEAALMAQEGADVNKAATGIALDREKANDAFLLGSTSALAAPGEAARADRSLGNQQWQMAETARNQADQAEISKWMGTLSLINQIGLG